MKTSNFYYPAALLLIIVAALYFLYAGFMKPPQVDLAAYQKLCNEYLQAPPGKYTHDQKLSLVYKVNYLFPDAADKLTVPAERELKSCAEKLEQSLK